MGLTVTPQGGPRRCLRPFSPPPLQPCPAHPSPLSVHQGPNLDSLQACPGGLAACWSSWMGAPRETFWGQALKGLGPLPTPDAHPS